MRLDPEWRGEAASSKEPGQGVGPGHKGHAGEGESEEGLEE